MSDPRESVVPGLTSAALPRPARERLTLEPFGRRGVAFAFEAYGARIGVELDDADLLDRVLEILPPNWAPAAGRESHTRYRLVTVPTDGGSAYQIDSDDVRLLPRASSQDQALRTLESEIEFSVAEYAEPYLFVHAGVVGWQGHTIVLPGESFAGKSTVVSALVREGATYFSDEFAVLNPDGCIIPYPRRLSLRSDPAKVARRIDLSHSSPHGNHSVPSTIGLIAFLVYHPGGEWRSHRLSAAEAVMALCKHTFAIRRRPVDAFDIFGRVVTRAPAIEGTRGEASEAAAQLLGACHAAHDSPVGRRVYQNQN